MRAKRLALTALVSSVIVCAALTGCGSGSSGTAELSGMTVTGSMELDYAEQFSVDYYDGGYSMISIEGDQQFLLVPEGAETPDGLNDDITVLHQPLDDLYVAASSAMDLFSGIDSLDRVRMTSTEKNNWSLDEVRDALDIGDLLYVGSYSAPDYETILAEGCGLAVESTMIYHSPEVQEQLEELGLPVLVEHSSYETHPLGRLEWIKLYGLLLGKEDEAEQLFDEKKAQVEAISGQESTGKTVAFFSINSAGAVTVRKPGDYVSKMISMAGGSYVPTAEELKVDDNALSTMNMQIEAFYAAAKDADYLIYNSTIEGDISTIDELIAKSDVLGDFKAVKNGNAWCTEKDMFQQSTGAADMIADLHAIVTGEADGKDSLTYLHRLK